MVHYLQFEFVEKVQSCTSGFKNVAPEGEGQVTGLFHFQRRRKQNPS